MHLINIRKILVVASFILIFFSNIRAQLLDEVCINGGKMELDYRRKPWKGNNKFLLDYLDEIKYFDNPSKVRYLIPVKFWVYHDNEGNGGAAIADLKQFIVDLNNNFELNQVGIQFYLSDIKNVNNSKRQTMGYYMESTLHTFFRHSKTAMNVYLIDGFKRKQESKKVIKGAFNIGTNSIVLQRKNTSTGLSHEVGHYLGLLHPHRHYNKGKSWQEPVSRIRTKNIDGKGIPLCEMRGDLLADTKAEPKLTYLVDNNCNFTGITLKDDWGDNYQSDINNIMSYPTHYRCRDSFTISQKAVMLYSAARIKYAKYWDATDEQNKKYFPIEKNEPNDFFEMAGSFETGGLNQFNFHKIFTGKNKFRSDTCDWLKFEVKQQDKRNVKIKMKANPSNSADLTVIFCDKNQILLSKQQTIEPGKEIELGFNGVVSDWYFLKVATKDNETVNLDSYSLEVQLY